MPNTRKKVIKAVYKDEDSEAEEQGCDYSDSGSDAKFSAESSSDEDEPVEYERSSGDEFVQKGRSKQTNRKVVKKPFAKTLLSKINKQTCADGKNENVDVSPALFSVKDLTEADKLLPPILNLSESDSSDDEAPKTPTKKAAPPIPPADIDKSSSSDKEVQTDYRDVWSSNVPDNSEEIAKKAFMELEQHKSKIEEAKTSIHSYTMKLTSEESDVKDLLALGEEVLPEEKIVKKKIKSRKKRDDSDSEIDDWEEVDESKAIPQQGIQLFVEFPDAGCRKSKKIDVEMMMKRKINRVKKEYQVYMHQVHVLCYLGHGNYVSRVINDQELMAASLSLVPSKECYPGERVDMKYVEQITTWYKDKLTLKQDKNEDKFKPKARPLKDILMNQIKSRVVTSRKYSVFIFISMLRALGLQCRVIFNFVTLPIKPPTSELCSLSTNPKDEKSKIVPVKQEHKKNQKSATKSMKIKKENVSQLDGNDDDDDDDSTSSDSDWNSASEFENIVQIDGSNDPPNSGTRKTRSSKRTANKNENVEDEDVSPPKIPKRSTARRSPKPAAPADNNKKEGKEEVALTKEAQKRTARRSPEPVKKTSEVNNDKVEDDDVSPPKTAKRSARRSPKPIEKENKPQTAPNKTQKLKLNDDAKVQSSNSKDDVKEPTIIMTRRQKHQTADNDTVISEKAPEKKAPKTVKNKDSKVDKTATNSNNKLQPPKITVTDEERNHETSKYFDSSKANEPNSSSKLRLSRQRSQTVNPSASLSASKVTDKLTVAKPKGRTKSAPGNSSDKSTYFSESASKKRNTQRRKEDLIEDKQRVSHKDLIKPKPKTNNDVTDDLIDIIKTRIKGVKEESKKNIVKGKIKQESDEDSDFLPEEGPKRISESDDDFKPTKISPKPSTSRKIDRRVLTPDDEAASKKIDVWCEIFVEELEQWISVDVIKGKIHNPNDFYTNATHPVCYIVGWDNNNYLKDLTRRYVPHWNTVTRKQRAEPAWWDKALRPWIGPKTARDREEDENLDRMQLEAPLPKSIAEYKNHPLYALKRHLLKFEALYPPDAAVLGFVRGEPVYARECVYICRSRDTWLKEAKVVKLGEKPYKVVKARPKWDKLSNKLITDKPLEVFGPWQVQEYEPPVAENGMVPRNAYGNVELFKDCMLPKGTVHLKLPGLNRVAKKLNIDCAPAMTGFDFNGGWSHPVYDGFVVCKEFEEIITEAWIKDQEEQERRELEKIEARVYGNWKRLIKGLLIRERLKHKYGFEEPTTSQTSKGKSKGPRLVVKKKS